MKKILIPLMIIIPVVLYLKIRKSSNNNGNKNFEKKIPVKPRNVPPDKISETKSIRVSKEPDKKSKTSSDSRCKAVTGSGKRCSRESLPDSDFCWQHS